MDVAVLFYSNKVMTALKPPVFMTYLLPTCSQVTILVLKKQICCKPTLISTIAKPVKGT